ncbi:hypothetical protein HDV04_005542 [Boothiomyces sp. JEL0838]|nr:hypothetical protein HDV04_005542 [Boothiomyces sp. JEL0838]
MVSSIFESLRERQGPNQVLDDILNQLFQEASANVKGPPPASKRFIETLPSSTSAASCSICLESCLSDSKILPCKHHNTCPSCRQEFETDDAEYERQKREKKWAEIRAQDSEEEWDPFYG